MANTSQHNESTDLDIRLCPLCSKPFTLASSYTRHVSYCRRTRDRQRRRQKSCQSCKIAKAKCSFDAPCSRCRTKGLDCVYESYETTYSTSSTAGDELVSAQPNVEVRTTSSVGLLGTSECHENLATRLDAYQSSASFDPDAELSNWPDLDLSLFSGELTQTIPSSLGWINPPASPGYLTRVHRSTPVAQQCALLLFEALCSIPEQMLRRETFPPFIHAYWNQPLPEPIAVCVQIAQIFSRRTDETRPFIWRTILAEQRRVLEKLPCLSARDLHPCLQCGMVYLIMRVIDGGSVPGDWDKEMTLSQSVMCDHFLHLCGGVFCESEETHPSLTWEDWIFAESRRRTSCVWFFIDRVISVKTTPGCPSIETPRWLPLPASKTLWEARSHQDWVEELSGARPPLSSFGDLMDCRNQSDDVSQTQKLVSWKARADGLGNLLSIAVAVA